MLIDQNNRLLLIFMKIVASVVLAFVFLSCASIKPKASKYKKPLVNIYIEPKKPENIIGDSIGIFNFNFFNEGQNNQFSLAFAEYVQKELLRRNFIRTIEMTECGYKNIDQAIKFGKIKGYDLILIGTIDKYYTGGLNTDSEVIITIKIIETSSAATLWFMRGQMSGTYSKGSDYIFFQTESKLATSPSILSQLIFNEMINILTKTNL